MPVTLIDYRISQPSSAVAAGVLPNGVTIPAPIGNTNLLGIFMSAGPQNRVDLQLFVVIANPLSLRGTALFFSFFRDGQMIWISEVGLNPNTFPVAFNFHAGDFNVTVGFHMYSGQISNGGPGEANVVGPVTFSAAAYSLT
ncbi:hypothetical protein O9H85_02485 [Paenibacillus filicis]|uniref:Exosporium leader peptide n=1 Tax=Paenibacillus gyeongsangnamensis TaxID=3388067 RepID=A0ABT4Q3B5_9BACL|nr:hypothetical protein [Paenibacillus filicis]MCZ8511322.1 hypothetical protein [Paenibacillus filicis]